MNSTQSINKSHEFKIKNSKKASSTSLVKNTIF